MLAGRTLIFRRFSPYTSTSLMSPADKHRNRRARIGCAGWSIAAAHRHLTGAGDSMLARYATVFDAVEINSSFYRPHQRKTYERWADSVPDEFQFAVKAPKSITHELRLRAVGNLLDGFMEEALGLGDKLGCLLVQLPPSLAFESRVASTFFSALRRLWSGDVACEPRHASWLEDAASTLWQRHRIARVGADPPIGGEQAAIAGGAGTSRYWRWHGSPRMYYSDYDDGRLRELVAEVKANTPSRADAWVIFDNIAHGYAIPNAARFRQLLVNGESR